MSDDGFLRENADRFLHVVVVTARGAIERLMDMGWSPASISMDIPGHDPLPCWVTLRGRRVFEIRMIQGDDGLSLRGEWILGPPRRTWWDRLWGR